MSGYRIASSGIEYGHDTPKLYWSKPGIEFGNSRPISELSESEPDPAL
jgi:hypothetical protein